MYASNFDMNLECVEAEMISGSLESIFIILSDNTTGQRQHYLDNHWFCLFHFHSHCFHGYDIIVPHKVSC